MKKLIRDNIPKIIEDEGKEAKISQIIYPDAFKWYVKQKLQEEVTEVIEAVTKEDIAEELGDLLSVMQKHAELHDIPWDSVERVQFYKAMNKGGFNKGYLMELE